MTFSNLPTRATLFGLGSKNYHYSGFFSLTPSAAALVALDLCSASLHVGVKQMWEPLGRRNRGLEGSDHSNMIRGGRHQMKKSGLSSSFYRNKALFFSKQTMHESFSLYCTEQEGAEFSEL